MYGNAPSPSQPSQPIQHDGQPLPPDDDYPVSPDGSIGRVISSATNRTRTGWKAMGAQERGLFIALPILAFIFGGMVGLIGMQELIRSIAMRGYPELMVYETPLMWIGGLGGAVIPTVVLLAILWAFRKHRASWVGTDGIQRWEKGLFGASSTVLRFADAATLTTQRIRQFVNGAYSGTLYTYTWWGPGNTKLLVLNGSFREPGVALIARDKRPPAHDPINFAEAAEKAWSRHKIARLDQEIRTSGVATFQNGATTLRIGRGFIEISANGKSERIERTQIATATVQQGVVTLKRQGATEGWFTSDGVYKLPVANMPDFMVFLMLFEEMLQLRFT